MLIASGSFSASTPEWDAASALIAEQYERDVVERDALLASLDSQRSQISEPDERNHRLAVAQLQSGLRSLEAGADQLSDSAQMLARSADQVSVSRELRGSHGFGTSFRTVVRGVDQLRASAAQAAQSASRTEDQLESTLESTSINYRQLAANYEAERSFREMVSEENKQLRDLLIKVTDRQLPPAEPPKAFDWMSFFGLVISAIGTAISLFSAIHAFRQGRSSAPSPQVTTGPSDAEAN